MPAHSPEEVFTKIKSASESLHPAIHVTAIGHHIVLQLPDEEQRYWSPQLTAEAEPHDDGGTLVRCLFAPKPAVWTFFIFLYSVSAFAALIGLITGGVQLSLQLTPSGFWITPLAVILFGVAYGLALKGQQLSRAQMERLHNYFLSTLNPMAFAEE